MEEQVDVLTEESLSSRFIAWTDFQNHNNPDGSVTSQQDKLLFTPEPLTACGAVKEVILRDVGLHDAEFVNVVREVRQHRRSI